MEKANVTWLGSENKSEPAIDFKDPSEGQKIAKAIDDYMNNETEEIDLETALTSL